MEIKYVAIEPTHCACGAKATRKVDGKGFCTAHKDRANRRQIRSSAVHAANRDVQNFLNRYVTAGQPRGSGTPTRASHRGAE